MKKILLSLGSATILWSLAAIASAVETIDVYTITMQLKVPQVVNNSQSLGKRAYQVQKITGKLLVYYYEDSGGYEVKAIEFEDLVNKTFKVGGKNVTYAAIPEFESGIPRIWNAIGNNKTLVFNRSSVCFNAEIEPNYAISSADNDNSLVLSFAGSGSMVSKSVDGVRIRMPAAISGYVTGTQGCACHDYGHVSPTRTIGQFGPTKRVVDVASVYGVWRARFNYRTRNY